MFVSLYDLWDGGLGDRYEKGKIEIASGRQCHILSDTPKASSPVASYLTGDGHGNITTVSHRVMTKPAANLTIELRLPVDVGEVPLDYANRDGTLDVEVMLAGGGYTNLDLPTDGARAWAADLFGAVTVAHREATGDPHALSDDDLDGWVNPDAYDPEPGLFLRGGSDGQPAAMRFHVLVDVQGQVLSAGHLRAAIVACLTSNLNVARVAVSTDEPVAGTPI